MPSRISLLAAILLLSAGPALAADEPVATASTAAPPTMSTADQIDLWLKSTPSLEADLDAEPMVPAFDDRKLHGEVTVGVGTRGYRHVSMRATAPLGETGRISVAFGETRGRDWRVDPRCDLQGMTPPRALDRLGVCPLN